MKVHKFSAIAAIKIINELERENKLIISRSKDKESTPRFASWLLQARDKWITGVMPESFSPEIQKIKIHELDDGKITVEFGSWFKFRISGDHVTKEKSI